MQHCKNIQSTSALPTTLGTRKAVLRQFTIEEKPELLQWLHYRRARKSTFTNWPSAYPHPYDMAAAGFFFTGIEDAVQCIHCRCTIMSWEGFKKSKTTPMDVHYHMSPDCTFLENKKEYLYGSGKLRSADWSQGQLLPPATDIHQPLDRKARYWVRLDRYVLLLMTLLTAINSAVSAHAVTQDLPPEWTPITPWKGLVAIKDRDMILAKELKPLSIEWDLTECRKAAVSIAEAITVIRTKIPVAGAAQHNELLDSWKGRIDRLTLSQILDDVPLVNEFPHVHTDPCPLEHGGPLTDTVCVTLAQEASRLKVIAAGVFVPESGSGSPSPRSPLEFDFAVNGLRDVAYSYATHMESLQGNIQELLDGNIPASFQHLFRGECITEIQKSCSISTTNHVKLEDLAPHISLNQLLQKNVTVTDVTENAVSVQLEVIIPCLTPDSVSSEYNLIALPYQHDSGFHRIHLDNTNDQIVKTPLGNVPPTSFTCPAIDGPAVLCRPAAEIDTMSITKVKGHLPNDVQLMTTIPETIEQPNVEIYEIDADESIVYTPHPTRIQRDCPGTTQHQSSELPAGTYHVKLPTGCSIKIPSANKELTWRHFWDAYNEEPLDVRNPLYMPITNGKLIDQITNLEISDLLDPAWSDHIANYWVDYTLASGIFVLIGILAYCFRTDIFQTRKLPRRRPHHPIPAPQHPPTTVYIRASDV